MVHASGLAHVIGALGWGGTASLKVLRCGPNPDQELVATSQTTEDEGLFFSRQ